MSTKMIVAWIFIISILIFFLSGCFAGYFDGQGDTIKYSFLPGFVVVKEDALAKTLAEKEEFQKQLNDCQNKGVK